MDTMHPITKFQLLAAIIGQDRAYRELEGAEAFGDVLIEILRRLHSWNDDKWNATMVIDQIFEAIAEEFRYTIAEWDDYGDIVKAEPTDSRIPKGDDVLTAVQTVIDEARAQDMPPELDIPDQH